MVPGLRPATASSRPPINTGAVAAADVRGIATRTCAIRGGRARLGIEADDANWFSSVIGALGETRGLDLFRDIVARNGISIRKGHSLLANLVVSGECRWPWTAYGYRVDELKKRGAPIDKVYLPPVIALPTGVAVLRKVPHPFAAVLFADFMLTDGQAISGAARPRRHPAGDGRDAGGPHADRSGKFIDEREKWTRLFKEIFVRQAR